jgi:hypothetical protein
VSPGSCGFPVGPESESWGFPVQAANACVWLVPINTAAIPIVRAIRLISFYHYVLFCVVIEKSFFELSGPV